MTKAGAFLWIFVFAFSGVFLTSAAAERRVLTLSECLEIALANHPSLSAADASVKMEKGRLSQTAAGDRLEVSGTVSTGRNGTEAGDSGNYSAGVSGALKVFDSGRSRYSIDAGRKTLSASEAMMEDTRFRTHGNVKQAYIDLLLSDAVRGQRDKSVTAFRRHLEQAQGFYDAGSRARFDVTKALVDLGNAELALVEAESDIDTARATLLNTLGVTDMDTDFDVVMPSWDISADSDFSDLALQNRADYRAAELRTLSGQSTLKAEARYASPTITLRGGWNETGSQINNLDAGWNTALSLSVPIVDGGVARARVAVANAQIQSLLSAQETLRQNIILETRKAELAVKNARAGMKITELTVLQAEENYELAEGRYETGVGSPLELTDALLSLTDARLASYRARYNFNNALINLERATGI